MTLSQITESDVGGTGMSFEHAKRAIDKINAAIAALDGLTGLTVATSDGEGGFAGYQLQSTYLSQTITHADLTAGATCTVALEGEPTAWIPLAVWCETTVETTSGDAATTGLSVILGTAGDDNGYLESTNVFGAASVKNAPAAVAALVGKGYRGGDALIAKFTAAGAGSEDCADITALSIRFGVLYAVPVSA